LLRHLDARQTVEPDELDQPLDLRLRAAQQQLAAAPAQPAREQRQVHHQRRVRERELRQIDNDVSLSAECARKSSAPASLSGPVLVPATTQRGRRVIEVDDQRNLAAKGLDRKRF
jgi:hypothetical protein